MSASPRPNNNLPQCVTDYINLVIKKIRYRRKVRKEVRAELVAHFTDALSDGENDEQKENLAQQLINDFGNPKLLATLIRRGKKRCRPLWKKAIIHTLQGCAVLLIGFVARSAYLFVGTPTVGVDYLAWLNDLVREEKDPSQNAKPYFDKAVALAETDWPQVLIDSDHKWWGDMSDEVRDVTRELLDKNSAALDLIREGVKKPYYWNEYQRRPLERDLPVNSSGSDFFDRFNA